MQHYKDRHAEFVFGRLVIDGCGRWRSHYSPSLPITPCITTLILPYCTYCSGFIRQWRSLVKCTEPEWQRRFNVSVEHIFCRQGSFLLSEACNAVQSQAPADSQYTRLPVPPVQADLCTKRAPWKVIESDVVCQWQMVVVVHLFIDCCGRVSGAVLFLNCSSVWGEDPLPSAEVGDQRGTGRCSLVTWYTLNTGITCYQRWTLMINMFYLFFYKPLLHL